MKVSIVIPVYNEADHLGACLEAIEAQTVRPYEVIVVNNNSTDETLKVAKGFAFVTVVNQPKQGVVHARSLGFDTASGEIIARIDADTLLPNDWLAEVINIFRDSDVAAVSGSITYHDIPYRETFSRIELFFRQGIADRMHDEVFLQGANMAIRRSSWQLIRESVCKSKGLHEDFDLAIHLHDAGQKVIFEPSLHAFLSLRRFGSSYKSFLPYALQNPRTYAVHGRTSQRHMYPVIALVIVLYLPIKILHRGYDLETGKFSLSKLLALPAEARVNPASFVD